MLAENIVIEDSILDEIVVYAFSEQHFCGLGDFSLCFAVYLKTGRASKAEELRLLEMANDVLVHIPELTAVTLVDDEDNFLIFVGIHDFGVLRPLNSIRHFLHCGNDELPVLVLHLFYKDICAVSSIDRAALKLVEFFGGLRV